MRESVVMPILAEINQFLIFAYSFAFLMSSIFLSHLYFTSNMTKKHHLL